MPVLPNQPIAGGVNPNSGILNQLGQAAYTGFSGSLGLNPNMNRQNVASMFQYSSNTIGPNVVINYPQASQDWRVRISLAPNSNYFYNDPNNSLLSPLRAESSNSVTSFFSQVVNSQFGPSGQSRVGVVFPYTPSITVTHTASYQEVNFTHSNYSNYFYNYSKVEDISISGEFTVQNINEGQYLLATIYFFRSLTKMFFGQGSNGVQAGNPPPIVYLDGFGEYYFPHVPCVVSSFAHTMPDGVDYMDVPEPGLTYNPYLTNPVLNSTRLPIASTIQITVKPMYSRLSQSQGFSLGDFARGALINKPGSGGAASAFGASQIPIYNGVQGSGGFL